jgi:putative transposase
VGKAEERLKRWTKPATCTLLEGAAADLIRTKPELIAENALLRQQLIVLERQVKHPTFTRFERSLLVVLARRLPHWKQALLIVKPETLLRWHRRGFKLFWRYKSKGSAPN